MLNSKMFANGGMGNVCQGCYGKYLPILVWEIFSNTEIGNVYQLLVCEMFANAGMENIYQYWFGKYLPMLVW